MNINEESEGIYICIYTHIYKYLYLYIIVGVHLMTGLGLSTIKRKKVLLTPMFNLTGAFMGIAR
jgi:hypothetical protein